MAENSTVPIESFIKQMLDRLHIYQGISGEQRLLSDLQWLLKHTVTTDVTHKNDMLAQIYERQKYTASILIKNAHGSNDGGWSTYPVNGPLDAKIFWLMVALEDEVVELKKICNWKWWKNPKPLDVGAAKEELIDILHFVMHTAIELGMTPEEILAEYIRKNDKNLQRQMNNY